MNINQYFSSMKNCCKSYSKKEVGEFMLYSSLIYLFYLVSGVYHQKLLKHQYGLQNYEAPQIFNEPIVFCFFPQLFASLISYLIKKFHKQQKEKWIFIPWPKALVIGLVINFNMWTYNEAIMQASFSAAIMIKSCGLLSVILVAVFCSKVKQTKLKLSRQKIAIGILVAVGIFIFNYFQGKGHQDSTDKPLTFITVLLLLCSLIGDGFLPDLQAEIKSVFKPSTISLYFHLNRGTSAVAFTYLLLSGKILYVYNFMTNCPQFCFDMAVFSILNSLGQLAVYRMIILFKQHIPAFVIATRKCFTVIVNIIIFGHKVYLIQGVGILLVFIAVLTQVYLNYKEKAAKLGSVSVNQSQQQGEEKNINSNQKIEFNQMESQVSLTINEIKPQQNSITSKN